jgi:hypothetical protein
VFRFIEAMIAGGERLGLSREQARALTLQTFVGASRLAADSDEEPSVLRERVTSRGGTTAAALAAAIQGNTAANALVTVANKVGNVGTGLVEAMASTRLAGGVTKRQVAVVKGFSKFIAVANLVTAVNSTAIFGDLRIGASNASTSSVATATLLANGVGVDYNAAITVTGAGLSKVDMAGGLNNAAQYALNGVFNLGTELVTISAKYAGTAGNRVQVQVVPYNDPAVVFAVPPTGFVTSSNNRQTLRVYVEPAPSATPSAGRDVPRLQPESG